MAEADSPDYFELFGLPRRYPVDRAELDSRFRALQRSTHPDRFASASDLERRLAAQQAVRINEGYQTLRDPLRRGRYLLKIAGIDHEDEHRTTRDTAFLMEQMELREELAAVREASDAIGALAEIMSRIAERLAGLDAELAGQLQQQDAGQLAEASETLMKMQFYRRLQEEAVELEMKLEDELVG